MLGRKLEISPAAVLMLALICFLDNAGIPAILAPAILVHEFGHYCVLRFCGCRVKTVRIGAFGIEMDYFGDLSSRELLCCAAAGPLLGLAYALLAFAVGGRYLQLSGTVSVLLSGFNLLPIRPLDGGRIIETLAGDTAAGKLSRCASVLLLLLTAVLTVLFGAWTLLAMSAWLVICNFSA